MGRIKGFYKDSKNRVRPITSRKATCYTLQRGTAHLGVPKRVVSKHETRRRLALSAMDNVLRQPWIPIEMQVGYLFADTIFENWNLINQPLEAYQKNGIEGVAEYVGTGFAQNELSSIQSKLVWAVVSRHIPAQYHDKSKEIVKTIIDQMTKPEIKFIKDSLHTIKDNEHKSNGKPKFDDKKANLKSERKKRMPRGMDYV